VVDKEALEQVFGDYFDFPSQSSTDCSTLILHPGWYIRTAVASVIVESVSLHPNKRKCSIPVPTEGIAGLLSFNGWELNSKAP
jgi:hypothetical protein